MKSLTSLESKLIKQILFKEDRILHLVSVNGKTTITVFLFLSLKHQFDDP